jgi:hypothetical protein
MTTITEGKVHNTRATKKRQHPAYRTRSYNNVAAMTLRVVPESEAQEVLAEKFYPLDLAAVRRRGMFGY